MKLCEGEVYKMYDDAVQKEEEEEEINHGI
jgi:hypothetical protein